MVYSIWSRGRVIGRSRLDYPASPPDFLAGDFEPTAAGESLLPVLTGLAPALDALAEVLACARATATAPIEWGGPVPPALRLTTEYADVRSLTDRLEQLDLELRDPIGRRVHTAAIGVQDAEHVLAIARRDGVFVGDAGAPNARQLPCARYQVVVELADAGSRPSA